MADEFAQHEALDRAFLVADLVDKHLAQHPFIAARADLAEQCQAISNALGGGGALSGNRDAE